MILAATAGHVDVVEILLDHGADMEAQSERTKDTPLSLACSGGRFEVHLYQYIWDTCKLYIYKIEVQLETNEKLSSSCTGSSIMKK